MHDPDRIGTSDIGIALPLLVRFLGIAKQSPAPQSWCDCRLRSPKCRDILQPVKKAASLSLQPPRTSQKGIQDQQTLRNRSTKRAHCPTVCAPHDRPIFSNKFLKISVLRGGQWLERHTNAVKSA